MLNPFAACSNQRQSHETLQTNHMKYLTEDQIEIQAERMQDRLDRAHMTTDMRSVQYQHESREIARWVEEAHEHRRKTVELAQWNNQHA